MISITPSDIIEYLFCARFTWFERVLRVPQHEEANYKVMRGRTMHAEKSARDAEYLRRRLGVQEKHVNVYLTNDLLRGEVDEVLLLDDGTAAPLDYKFAQWEGRLYDTYHTQLLCYAWLIETHYARPVRKGYIVYTRSKHYVHEVPIRPGDLERIQAAARGIATILRRQVYPPGTRQRKKCAHCTYRNLCTR